MRRNKVEQTDHTCFTEAMRDGVCTKCRVSAGAAGGLASGQLVDVHRAATLRDAYSRER